MLNFINKRYINKVLAFLGSLSLELYLSHVLMQKIFFDYNLYGLNKVHNFHLYLKTIFIGAIVIAVTVSGISTMIIKKLQGR